MKIFKFFHWVEIKVLFLTVKDAALEMARGALQHWLRPPETEDAAPRLLGFGGTCATVCETVHCSCVPALVVKAALLCGSVWQCVAACASALVAWSYSDKLR